jgi:hypothetical protein
VLNDYAGNSYIVRRPTISCHAFTRAPSWCWLTYFFFCFASVQINLRESSYANPLCFFALRVVAC